MEDVNINEAEGSSLFYPFQFSQQGCAAAVVPGADDVCYKTGDHGVVVQAQNIAVDFQHMVICDEV